MIVINASPTAFKVTIPDELTDATEELSEEYVQDGTVPIEVADK